MARDDELFTGKSGLRFRREETIVGILKMYVYSLLQYDQSYISE